MNHYFVDVYDTFWGENNHSCITRLKVSAKTMPGAVLKVSLRTKRSWCNVGGNRYDSTSDAKCFFIEEFDADSHGQYKLTEI